MKNRLRLAAMVFFLSSVPAHGQGFSPAGGNAPASATGAAGCFSAPGDSQPPNAHGFDLSNLDRGIKPCDDFFLFGGGGWIKSNPIPPEYPSWGTFNRLADHNLEILRGILESETPANTKPGSNERKIGDFYASCMDEAEIEKQGMAPLAPELARIAAIRSFAKLEKEVARLHSQGVNVLFGFGSEQDFKNSGQEIAAVSQGGLGLPDRDYYTRTDDKSKELRDAYVQHVQKMLELAGDSPANAAAEAKAVMALETRLAQASMTRVDRRDPDKVYHKMSTADLKLLAPHFAWKGYLAQAGLGKPGEINVEQPDFLKGMDAELAGVSLAEWKTYLRWHLIHSMAAALPGKFVEEDFNFYRKTLTGAKEILPRWKRCVRATDTFLGEALGQAYVAKAFPPEAKASALAMVKNLLAVLREDLATLDWMGPETRKQAIAKLDAIGLKIGYPDKWRDYSALSIDRGPYALNVIRGEEFEFHRDVAKIGRPVDRTEWGMTPPTVNAYYNPSMNEIVFPAGILQPPFFDADRDDALNYGGIGAVIGHEMTHGFDDQGRKFDAQGNLRDWWTPEDMKNFQDRAECIVKQFDGYEVEPGLHENGKLVVGESIADLGGFTLSFRAFEKTLAGKPSAPEVDGFTPEQRFFLGAAQVWASSIRPEYARLLTNTDPHPLPHFREMGSLSNMPAFEKAWACKEGDQMVRPEALRCHIW